MTIRNAFVIVVVLLCGSVIVSAGLLFALRSQYVETKILAARPHHIDRFAAENYALNVDRRTGPIVLLFGDSRVDHWTPEPGGAGWQVVNRGVSGETTEQMKLRFHEDVLAIRPDVLVIQAGINDLVAASLARPPIRGEIVDGCIENLVQFAEGAAAQGIDVVVMTIYPPAPPPLLRRLVWDQSIWSLVDKVNIELERLRSIDGIAIVDSAGVLIRSDGSWYEGAAQDTLHLTEDGYERLNRAVKPIITRLLGNAVQ